MFTKNKKILLALIMVTLVGVAAIAILKGSGGLHDNTHPASTQEEDPVINEINYDPPTNEEKQAGDDKKANIKDDQPNNSTDGSAPEDNASKKSVKPVITSAGQFGEKIEVRAFMPGIYESNGACTVVFTKDNNKIERQVEGIQDATTTRCDTVMILREDFPSSGTWTVKVTYSSPSSQGESDVEQIEVQ